MTTAELFIVWIPGTGLALHHAWLAYRRKRAINYVMTWRCDLGESISAANLPPEKVRELFAELRQRAVAAGELP